MKQRLLPEWHAQEAVILAWPDKQTDWHPWLDDVQATYRDLIGVINAAGAGVILLIKSHEIEAARVALAGVQSVLLVPAEYNDTWVRDYAFLTAHCDGENRPLEFEFNGWGQKFDAHLDNQVNSRFLAGLLKNPIASIDLVCEGGALEIDAQGRFLSTALCLGNPKRNASGVLQAYTEAFDTFLGATETIILEHGHLEGDDTDGHIDTLVRFSPENKVLVQTAFNRPQDTHYAPLEHLKQEVCAALPAHDLLELPLPEIFDEKEVTRLPASYANFLICNDYVLCPVYRADEDDLALERIAKAFPGHKIRAVDCASLIKQYGSLHCITMQVPKGTLKQEILEHFNRGLVCLDKH